MEVVFNFCKPLAFAEIFAQSIDLDGLIGVSHRHLLLFLVVVEGSLALHLLRLLVITALLVRKPVEPITFRRFARFVWLQRLHQLFSGGNGPMNGFPNRLWLVHVGVFRADRDSLHNLLLVQHLSVGIRQLKDLIRLPLLRGLVFLQVFNFRLVVEKLLKNVWLAADEVDVRRVLGLPLVEHLEDLALGVPKATDMLVSI